jgi:hypothetical protein
MSKKTVTLLGKFGLGVIAACALCCAPLIASLIVGAGGIAFLVEGNFWYAVAALVVTTMYLVYRQTRKVCGCSCNSKCKRCDIH